ncbi:MAG: aquaporin family protein [Bacteroidia bacterium]|nr:aquaporin family protein [Bacteroidia bacterium]
MNKYIIEFIGTFFLAFTVSLTGNPLAIGAALMVLIYMGGSVSGAHYNPAITIAVWIQKKIHSKDVGLYIVSQCLGVAMASAAFHLLYGNTRVFFLSPDVRINILKPLFIETVFTFMLTMVVLYTAVAKKNASNQYYPLAIGMTLMAAAYAGGSISGGAFNPAVGAVPIIAETVIGICSCHPINHLWLYVAGPILGATAAAVVFRFVIREEV